MSSYSVLDCLQLMAALEKVAQTEPTQEATPGGVELPAAEQTQTKAIAIKRLQAIIGDKSVAPGTAPGTQPGQAPKAQSGQTPAPISSDLGSLPLPLNNNFIDFTRIHQWLAAYEKQAIPSYQPIVQKALNSLLGLVGSKNDGWAPISLSQPVDEIYTDVRDFYRGRGAAMAVDQPLLYLQRLRQFIGDVVKTLNAFESQFPGSPRVREISQQSQFAQYIQVELSSWMGQIPGVQQKLDGKR